MKKYLYLFVLFLFLTPLAVFAHQPRIVESAQIKVADPEISKAYYGKLEGSPHIYRIVSDRPFNLYVNVLVPDIAGQKKDVSAAIIKDGNLKEPLAVLDGQNFEWKKFFEEFGYDSYWVGPEYKAEAGAGVYEIFVSSANNDSKYALAIGETESFDFKEIMNALNLIPKLKRNFFNESPANFIFSPFGWGLILIMYVLAFVIGLIYRMILRHFASNKIRKSSRNIGAFDRLLRAVIGIALLVLAICTSWNPFLLFVSGLAIFEAIFGWCGVCMALGKNTCKIN